MSAIESKRSRDKMNLKYIWHLRFGHIEEDRINKLEWNVLLDSSTLKSFLIYKFCLQEKNDQTILCRTQVRDH